MFLTDTLDSTNENEEAQDSEEHPNIEDNSDISLEEEGDDIDYEMMITKFISN